MPFSATLFELVMSLPGRMPCHAAFHHPANSKRIRSETTTAATTFPPSRVGRGGGNVFDTSNLHTGAGKRAKSRLSTWARGLGSVTACGTNLDVESVDAEFLASYGCSMLSTKPDSKSQQILLYAPTSWAANIAA